MSLDGPGAGRGARGAGTRTTARGAGAGDRGAGTVLVVGVVAVLLALTVAAGQLARATHARAVAQTAADLAALAASSVALDPTVGVDPCAVARRVAAAHEVALVSCAARADGTVDVTTGRAGATARARAGPVGAPGPAVEVPPAPVPAGEVAPQVRGRTP